MKLKIFADTPAWLHTALVLAGFLIVAGLSTWRLEHDELVLAGIEQVLSQPDETFHKAVDYVLKKNAELYRRLA